MTQRIRVDVEDVLKLAEERKRINTSHLKDIAFYYCGNRVEIPEEEIKRWNFIGLNNIDFVLDRDWDGCECPMCKSDDVEISWPEDLIWEKFICRECCYEWLGDES